MSNHTDVHVASQPAVRPSTRTSERIVVTTKFLVALHALTGLLLVLAAAFFFLDHQTTPPARPRDVGPLDDFDLFVAMFCAIAGGLLLVPGTVSLMARRPGWVHGAGLLVGLVVLVPMSLSGFAALVYLVPLLLVPAGAFTGVQIAMWVAPIALVVSSLTGLVVARRDRAAA